MGAVMTTERSKHLVVVLGMHRSGTSAIARSLQIFGVELGSRLYGAVLGENGKEVGEDIDVNSLNETLLASLGQIWRSLNPALPAMLSGAVGVQ